MLNAFTFSDGNLGCGNLDARVIRLQNLFVSEALFCQSISADLAHADTMAPAASAKHKLADTTVVVILAINDEELFAQAQRRSNPAAPNVGYAIRADNLQIRHPAGRAAGDHTK